jgi:hypothetical protein
LSLRLRGDIQPDSAKENDHQRDIPFHVVSPASNIQ